MIARIRIEEIEEKESEKECKVKPNRKTTVYISCNAIYRCTTSIYTPHLTAAHVVCALRALVY